MFRKILKQLNRGSSERRHRRYHGGSSSKRGRHYYHSGSSSKRRHHYYHSGSSGQHRHHPMSGSKRYKRRSWGSSS